MAGSIDLEDLIPDLVFNLNSPGGTEYETVSKEEWVSRLRDAFWTAFNDGLLLSYIERDGTVSPKSGTTPMPRDLQQIIILYTGISVLRQKLLNLQTVFRTKAGPVEYEVQQSAQIAKALLDDLSQRRQVLLNRLADTALVAGTYLIDGYAARQQALNDGLISWVGN